MMQGYNCSENKDTNIMVLEIDEIVKKLINKKAWDVKIGYGSFLTMEFGLPLPSKERGQWHLWIYCCSWRMEKEKLFIAGSEDTTETMKNAANLIDNQVAKSFVVSQPSLDIEICFSNMTVLKTFSIHSEKDGKKHWMLYMPDNKTLSAGPGNNWGIFDSTSGDKIYGG
jgi:hypothetical protein